MSASAIFDNLERLPTDQLVGELERTEERADLIRAAIRARRKIEVERRTARPAATDKAAVRP